MVLAVVADISQQGIEGMPAVGLARQAMKLQVVGLGTAVDDRPDQDVRLHVDHRGDLGKPVISPPAAMAEVGRCGPGIHPGGVDRGQFAAILQKSAFAGEGDSGVQETLAAPLFSSRLAASCNVR